MKQLNAQRRTIITSVPENCMDTVYSTRIPNSYQLAVALFGKQS